MATQPPPEFPTPSEPLIPDGPPPEISPPTPDVDVPAPGEVPTGPANPVG